MIWFFELFGIKITFIKSLKWLKDMDIKTVLDIGANDGSSAIKFHGIMPEARIYSFEPLGECFEKLERSIVGFGKFKAYNVALGDTEGSMEMNRSEASASSSLLEMGDLHKACYPHTAEHTAEKIEVRTLDRMVERGEVLLEGNVLMKIDVQGFEGSVLRGSVKSLERIKVVIVETSFQELYKGQPLFAEVYEFLHSRGFIYMGTWENEAKSPIDGAAIYSDGIYVKGGRL